MDLDVEQDTLPVDSIAHYAWGHHRIWLAPDASPDKSDFVMRAVAQIVAGKAQWPTVRAFKAFVSVCHEFVHYQQDIGTGCGYWDDHARRGFLSVVFTKARDRSWFPKTPLPLEAQVAQDAVDRYAADSVFNFHRRRQARAADAIRAEFGKSAAHLEGVEVHFGVPSLLELDAVLATKRVIQALKTDAKGRQVAQANLKLFSPLKMGDPYRVPYEYLLSCFHDLLGLDTREAKRDDIEHLLDVVEVCAPVLLDIALAYPPPAYFSGPREADRPHFEPGIRLVRVLRALAAAPDVPLKDVDADLEKLARVTAEHAYPSMQSTYEGWAQHFEARVSADPIAAFRRDQCAARLQKPHAIERRNLVNIVSHGIPVMLDSPKWPGQRMLITGAMLVDDGQLYAAIRRTQDDLALAQWFLGGSPKGYVCSEAGSAAFCQGATPGCRSGLPALWNFPVANRCSVRRMLDRMGFDLTRPLV